MKFAPHEKFSFQPFNLEEVHDKAKALLNSVKIKERDFKGAGAGYGEEEISKDLCDVLRAKRPDKGFKQEDKTGGLALVFEGIVYVGGQQGVFGRGTKVEKTSDFDDTRNGVDIIAEFPEKENQGSCLGLAIDLTIFNQVSSKIDGILKKINEGKLSTVKYHKKKDGRCGSEIPLVVVGLEGKTVERLAKLWHEDEEELSSDPVQLQIFEEILLQLETYRKYADEHNQPGIAGQYEKYFNIVDNIYQTRLRVLHQPKIGSSSDRRTRDSYFHKLKSILDDL
ncbi:MAG: hypothetical protein ABIB72_00510 [Candidatus Falkowbacteria bacterium]